MLVQVTLRGYNLINQHADNEQYQELSLSVSVTLCAGAYTITHYYALVLTGKAPHLNLTIDRW